MMRVELLCAAICGVSMARGGAVVKAPGPVDGFVPQRIAPLLPQQSMPSCTCWNWGASVPRTHPRHHDCVHDETVSVIADGLERVICEQCGHVTVRYESMISGDVERSQFPRRADERARRSIQARWPYRGAG